MGKEECCAGIFFGGFLKIGGRRKMDETGVEEERC